MYRLFGFILITLVCCLVSFVVTGAVVEALSGCDPADSICGLGNALGTLVIGIPAGLLLGIIVTVIWVVRTSPPKPPPRITSPKNRSFGIDGW
jgi:hypothetical protein